MLDPRSAPAADAMSHEGLRVRGLDVVYPAYGGQGVHAVRGVDLDVGPSEIVGLVGEMGCGKTTLARAIMGVLRAPGHVTAGDISFGARDLRKLDADSYRRIRGREIAMIVPNPRGELDPLRTVGEQISTVVRTHLNLDRKAARELALETLESVRIPDPLRRYDAYPHELSGGMAQRVVIAIALACSPRFIISDDATSGLDVTVQAQILDLLAGLAVEKQTSMLYITRDIGVASHFCTRIALMYRGEIVESAERDAFFRAPAHPYGALLIAAFAHAPDLGARGMRPELAETGSPACTFAPRCPCASARCLAQAPVLRTIATDHAVRCHHPISTRSLGA